MLRGFSDLKKTFTANAGSALGSAGRSAAGGVDLLGGNGMSGDYEESAASIQDKEMLRKLRGFKASVANDQALGVIINFALSLNEATRAKIMEMSLRKSSEDVGAYRTVALALRKQLADNLGDEWAAKISYEKVRVVSAAQAAILVKAMDFMNRARQSARAGTRDLAAWKEKMKAIEGAVEIIEDPSLFKSAVVGAKKTFLNYVWAVSKNDDLKARILSAGIAAPAIKARTANIDNQANQQDYLMPILQAAVFGIHHKIGIPEIAALLGLISANADSGKNNVSAFFSALHIPVNKLPTFKNVEELFSASCTSLTPTRLKRGLACLSWGEQKTVSGMIVCEPTVSLMVAVAPFVLQENIRAMLIFHSGLLNKGGLNNVMLCTGNVLKTVTWTSDSIPRNVDDIPPQDF